MTNIPSINNSEHSINSQIAQNTDKITSHSTNENIDKITKPSNVEKTSIVDNTEKDNTQIPIKEKTENIITTSSLPEEKTNKPSIQNETEPTNSLPNKEQIKYTTSVNNNVEYITSFPSEKISTTTQNNNEIVNTTIPFLLNLTSISTGQVENPKSTIIRNIVLKTEEINAIVDFVVTMIGLSHIKI